MSRIQSAMKQHRKSLKRRARNRYWKSTMRTAIKKVRKSVETKALGEAKTHLQEAIKTISRVASKGIIHKNTASRNVSRLTKLVNRLSTPV